MTPFQKYWADLKTNNVEKYEHMLSSNRDRQRSIRKFIYQNKELHEKYKAENRRKYRERKKRSVNVAKPTA